MATTESKTNEKNEHLKSEYKANIENSNEFIRELIGVQSKQINNVIEANKKLAEIWSANLTKSASLIEHSIEASKKLSQHSIDDFSNLYDKQFDWFYSWWKE